MTISEEVVQIEQDLAEKGWSPDDLCRAAAINRSTWTRWKSGAVTPNLATWQKVRDVLSGFTDPKPKKVGEPSGGHGSQVAAV